MIPALLHFHRSLIKIHYKSAAIFRSLLNKNSEWLQDLYKHRSQSYKHLPIYLESKGLRPYLELRIHRSVCSVGPYGPIMKFWLLVKSPPSWGKSKEEIGNSWALKPFHTSNLEIIGPMWSGCQGKSAEITASLCRVLTSAWVSRRALYLYSGSQNLLRSYRPL